MSSQCNKRSDSLTSMVERSCRSNLYGSTPLACGKVKSSQGLLPRGRVGFVNVEVLAEAGGFPISFDSQACTVRFSYLES